MKIPYEQLYLEVDKLYNLQIDIADTTAIDKRCKYIADFINACGWDETEFSQHMMRQIFDNSNTLN